MSTGSQSIISVIIVNRNTKNLLKDCIESLPIGFSAIPYEVWVVDNGSDDGSVEMLTYHYPHIHLIRNSSNLGFARANNQALRRIDTPFALLLNSDTLLTKDSIVGLYHFLKSHPQAAVVGPKLVNKDGTLQYSTYPLPQLWKDVLLTLKIYKLLPGKLKSTLFLGSFWDHDKKRKVGRITGACILLRMKDIKSIDFLDENFFFYGEIHDLCWTLWERGRHIWFNPDSLVIHLGGQTSKKIWNYKEQRRRMWRENERLLRKHRTPNSVRMHILLNWIGFLLASMNSATIKLSSDRPLDKDLLALDYDWHRSRLKEMLWYKMRHLFHISYRLSFYTNRFKKKFIRKMYFDKANLLQFNSETDRIQHELTEKWTNESSDGRTGFMDFSCSVLLYHIIRWFKPRIVVETGVANGVTSTFILSAMDANKEGKLYSIDWPGGKDVTFVPEGKETGWMVPDPLRKRWTLEIGRSEDTLLPILDRLGEMDIFLHDSDHSYETMMYEYRTAWPHVATNGLLLSDDVKMNTAFAEFTKDMNTLTMIYKGRLGIAQKLE